MKSIKKVKSQKHIKQIPNIAGNSTVSRLHQHAVTTNTEGQKTQGKSRTRVKNIMLRKMIRRSQSK